MAKYNTLMKCQQSCQATEGCMVFSYKRTAKECWLKKSDAGRRTEIGYISGWKECDADGV